MMIEPLRVLVPLDGSGESETVLPAVLPLAKARAADVTLLRVVSDAEDAGPARAALRRLARALLMDGVRTVSRLEWGAPADEIEYLARPSRHDLLAMPLGSAAEALLRRVAIPMILQRPGSPGGDWRRIVVALDGVTPADELLRDVEPLALALGSTVHVLPLGSEPDPRPCLDALASRGIRALPGAIGAASGLAAYLEEHGVGLLALATRGRAGLPRLARQSPVPVLLRRVEAAAVPP